MDHSWQPIYVLKKSFFKKLYWRGLLGYLRLFAGEAVMLFVFPPKQELCPHSGYYTLMAAGSCWTHLCCLVCAFPDQDIKLCSRRGGCLDRDHPLNLITFVSTWVRGNSCRFIYCGWGGERVEKYFPLKGYNTTEVWKKKRKERDLDSYLEKRMLLHVARDGCSRFTVSS